MDKGQVTTAVSRSIGRNAPSSLVPKEIVIGAAMARGFEILRARLEL